MTCVVAVRDKDRVYIGADTQGTAGTRVHALARPKVFINGPYILAACASFRLRDLLAYSFNPPPPPIAAPPDVVHQFMATEFVDALRECLKEGGFAHVEDEQEGIAGTVLVAWQGGELWYVDQDYQTGTYITDYTAIGAGEGVALGSLFSTRRLSPVRRIAKALEAAEYHDTTVRRPFHVLSI